MFQFPKHILGGYFSSPHLLSSPCLSTRTGRSPLGNALALALGLALRHGTRSDRTGTVLGDLGVVLGHHEDAGGAGDGVVEAGGAVDLRGRWGWGPDVAVQPA